jgi:pyruvate dehydrogenase E1 component alpha subunit
MNKPMSSTYNFFEHDLKAVLQPSNKEFLKQCLKEMLLIRNFENRAEAAYLQGKVGGFFHSYQGQEAIQTAAVNAMGKDNWWTTSYRCHALALLLEAHPNELMAELYGRSTGNAKGRGGSMHFFTDRLLGGHGIVGGQIPIATGAAFSAKYQQDGKVSVCFMGDGAVAQGSFHESLNLAALWDLPCIYVIENNQWSMGTALNRSVSVDSIADKKAVGYGIKSYTIDGMDFFNCYSAFKQAYAEVKQTSKPILIEAICERFRGHSISDPGAYRSKDQLAQSMERDPIKLLKTALNQAGMLTDDEYKILDEEQKIVVIEAMKFADESPWPNPIELGEDVFAP